MIGTLQTRACDQGLRTCTPFLCASRHRASPHARHARQSARALRAAQKQHAGREHDAEPDQKRPELRDLRIERQAQEQHVEQAARNRDPHADKGARTRRPDRSTPGTPHWRRKRIRLPLLRRPSRIRRAASEEQSDGAYGSRQPIAIAVATFLARTFPPAWIGRRFFNRRGAAGRLHANPLSLDASHPPRHRFAVRAHGGHVCRLGQAGWRAAPIEHAAPASKAPRLKRAASVRPSSRRMPEKPMPPCPASSPDAQPCVPPCTRVSAHAPYPRTRRRLRDEPTSSRGSGIAARRSTRSGR